MDTHKLCFCTEVLDIYQKCCYQEILTKGLVKCSYRILFFNGHTHFKCSVINGSFKINVR